MVVASGVLFLSGVWLAVTALMARGELNQVRAQAHTLGAKISASDWAAARTTSTDLAAHAHRANQLTSGPIWALAAALPSGGEPLKTIRGITSGVDSLSHALPQLINTGQRLNPRTLRRPDGSLDLARIAAAGPNLRSASASVAKTTAAVKALPRHTWLGSIDAAYADALKQFTGVDDALRSADVAARILPKMLGQDGPKRYFLSFQNEAEARGTGGLPGAFTIVEANRGKLRFTRMESDTLLSGTAATVDFGTDFHNLYDGGGATTHYGNSNLSPNFPYAAQIWASMWQKYSGEKVDGAIAVDPTALSYLLAVTGPATLPDNSQLTADNAVALTQSTTYAKFPGTTMGENARRRAYLLGVASAASKQILSVRGEPSALLRAAGQAAGERRLLVWSADPAVQAQLARTPMSGLIPATKAPYVGLSIINGGGNKLDFYLDRSLTWQRTGCGPIRRTTVTITLTNDAPATGLPPYVSGRLDSHSYPVKAGDNRLIVSYLATQGSRLEGLTIAGKTGTASVGAEQGHPVYAVDLELPRGAPRTIVLHLSEPAVGTDPPEVLNQPLVRPLRVTINDSVCG